MPSPLGTRERQRPVFETLEPRILLSADLSFGAAFDDPNDLTLRYLSGTDEYELFDTDTGGTEYSQTVAADADNIVTVTGDGDNEILRLDLDSLQGIIAGEDNENIKFLGGGGTDTLAAEKNTNFTLNDNALHILGNSFNLTGSDFEKAELTGGASGNFLNAAAFTGDATLSGLGGDDVLIGGEGNDTLIGGLGDDTYRFVDGWGADTVQEIADEGTDRLDFATLGTTSLSDLNLNVTGATKNISSDPGDTVTQSTTAAEELDVPITPDIQDEIAAGFFGAKDLVARLTATVEQLSAPLPMLDPDTGSLSNLFGLSDMFKELQEQVSGLGAASKLSDISNSLPASLPTAGSGLTLSQGYQGESGTGNLELLLDARLSKMISESIGIDFGDEGSFLNFNIAGTLDVDADFDGGVQVGSTTVGTPQAFLGGADLNFNFSVEGDLDTADLDLGFLSATVNTGAGTDVSFNGGLTVLFTPDGDGKLTLAELTALNATDLADLIEITPSGSSFSTGPLNVSVASGINIEGVGLLSNATLQIDFPSVEDFFDGTLPTISLESADGTDLLDFSRIEPGNVVDMLKDLTGTLSALANSELLDLTVPLTGKTLGELLNFGKGFNQDIINELYESGNALAPDTDGDGLPDFTFESIQELVDNLAPIFGLGVGGLVAQYNKTDRELRFSLDFSSALGLGGVDITTDQTGNDSDPQNEIQRVQVNAVDSGGDLDDAFRLGFRNPDDNVLRFTDAIALGATAAQVESALGALDEVGPGDFSVTLDGDDYLVEFTGSLAETDVQALTADSSELQGALNLNLGGGLTTPEGLTLADVSLTSDLTALATLDFGLDFGIGLGPSEDIELTPPPFSPDNQADVTLALQEGAAADDFVVQVVTVENATAGTYTLTVGGTGPTVAIDFDAPATGPGSVKAALDALDGAWDVEVTDNTDPGTNDRVFTVKFVDQLDTDKPFDPGALMTASTDNLKGAADGILSGAATFDLTLVSRSASWTVDTDPSEGGETLETFNVAEAELGSISVTISADDANTSLEDLEAQVRAEVNAQLAAQGLSLGFLDNGELSTGYLMDGQDVDAAHLPFSQMRQDVRFTIFIDDGGMGDPEEHTGTLRAVDVLDTNDDGVLSDTELNASVDLTNLETALNEAVFDVLDSAGLWGTYEVIVGQAVGGTKLNVLVDTAPGGHAVKLAFKSPVNVDSGGGRIALSAASGNLSTDVFNPSIDVTSRIEVTAEYDNPAFQEMGLLSSPTPFDGDIEDTIEFELVLDGTPVTVTLPASDYGDIDNLVTQLNTAVNNGMTTAGFGPADHDKVEVFRVDPEGNRLGIRVDNSIARAQINVPETGNLGAVTELGFEAGEGDLFTGASAEFFIDNAELDATVSLGADTIEAFMQIGFLEVEADGSGSIDFTANMDILDPFTGGARVIGATLLSAVNENQFLHDAGAVDNTDDIPDTGFIEVAVGGGFLFDFEVTPGSGIGFSGLGDLSLLTLSIDGTEANWLDNGLPDVNVEFSSEALEFLQSFDDLTFGDILDGLQFVVDLLQSLEGTGGAGDAIAEALAFELPLINRSIADLVEMAGELADRIDAVAADPAGSVQQLDTLLGGVLNDAGLGDVLSYDALTKELTFNLGFERDVNLTRPFALNLEDVLADAEAPDFLSDLVSLEAGGNLGVSASILAALNFGLDLDDQALFLVTGASGTRFAASASATGSNLEFRAGLGPFQVLVQDGTAGLGGSIEVELMDDGSGRLDIASLGGGIDLSGVNVDVDIIGALSGGNFAEANLPLYVGTVDNPIPIATEPDNAIVLGVDLQGLLNGVDDAFDITLPDLNLFEDPPGIFDLLADPAVVVEGLDEILLQLQNMLEGELFGFELPFVGDALKDNPVAGFIEDFRDDFLQPLAQTMRDNNVNLDGLINLIQESIFDTFDQPFLGDDPTLLKDANDDGMITQEDVVHSGFGLGNFEDRFIQFDFTIGDSINVPLADIDFDFGIPGLGLSADFMPTLTLAWTLRFGFGVDERKGFYFVTDFAEDHPDYVEGEDTRDELELTIDLDLGPDADASGQLLFLALEIEDGLDFGSGEETSNLHLGGVINVTDPNSDGRLTVGEMIAGNPLDLFQPELTGSADIFMSATVDFSSLSSDVDLSRVLPSISTDLIVHWEITANPGSGLDVTTPSVALADVSLDVGSFISDFAAPVLGTIADVIGPLDFLIGPDGFLNKRIPLLSDLAGKTITGRDLIETFDPTAKIGPFLDAIAELFFLIDLVEDAEAALASTGSLVFNFGDLILTDAANFFDDAKFASTLNDPIPLGLPSLSKGSISGVNFNNMSLDAPASEGSGSGQAVNRFKSGVSEGGSLQFKLFDPATIFSLIMGQSDVTLFTYELPEFGFDFFYSQKFPIFGPLTASLGGGIGGTIDIGFGMDTRGLEQFAETLNPVTLINGFFLNDLDPVTGEDRPEATLSATIVASAQLDFLIASAGVEGGVDINIFFNLADLDGDGKIRFDEMAANLAANSFNPLSVFDTTGVAEFFMRAFIEINLLVTKIRKTFEFVRVELFSFEIPFERPGILATQDGDTLTLSIGPNSENRLNGNVDDIAETIHVKSVGSDVVVWSDQFNVGESVAEFPGGLFRFSGVNRIVADGGKGNDVIDLSGLDSGYEVIIHGGVGDDKIIGSKGNDELYGGPGNDMLMGMGGNDLLDGGAGNDILYGDFEDIGLTIEGRAIDSLFGGTAGDDTLLGGAGNDELFGHAGDDTLDPGAGTDQLDGGVGDDVYRGLLAAGVNTIDSMATGNDSLDFSGVRERITFTLRNGEVTAEWDGHVFTGDLSEIVTILGGRSEDTFHVYETHPTEAMLLDGQERNDKFFFYIEDNDHIDAVVRDQGNPWDSNNLIEVVGTGGNDTITLTDATIDIGTDQLITYVSPPRNENVVQVKLKGHGGRDNINIKSTSSTVPVTVFTGAGDDTVTVGDNGTLDNINALLRPGLNTPNGLGPLTLIDGGGHDTVIFDNDNDPDAEGGNLTAFKENRIGEGLVEVGVLSGLGMGLEVFDEPSDSFVGLTGRVEFEGFEAVDVFLGGGANDFRIGGDAVKNELTEARLKRNLNTDLDKFDDPGKDDHFTHLIDGIVSIHGGHSNDIIRVEATNDLDRDLLNTNLGLVSTTTTPPGGGGGSNEEQRINVRDHATVGYFTLKYRFMETAPIALDAAPEDVKQALEDLFIIGENNVDVSLDGNDFVVEFVNDLADTDVAQLEAKVIPLTVFGDGGGDQLYVQSLNERAFFLGGLGDDLVKLNVNADSLVPLTTNGVQSEITLDGGQNNDTYQLGLIGGATDSLIHVFDSGATGTDVLEVTGTVDPDLFLLRAAAAESGLAFIALLNDDPNVERINYNTNLEIITIDSLAGDDEFYIDDTRATITIDSGAGNDFFQVGQLYKSQRTPLLAGVAQEDVFATIETTRGWLSNGISNDLTINAGDDEDEIVVFHNLAVLTVNGEGGDDTIIVQAFALVGSQEDKRERTDISGGADADFIAYAVNAPVNIDGGDGFDTVIVIGTEFSDDFVITDNGVFGAGLNVNFRNVEKLEVNGAEGDDRFFVQSTGENFTTSIVGDRGSDTFFINGETPANGVISNDLKGHSGIITHSVESFMPGSEYDGAKVVGVSSNVADNDEPAVIINESDGQSQVVEGGGIDTYTVVLSRPPRPDKGDKVKVTALPPEGIVFVDEFGEELRNETTDAPIGVELIFDDTNWNVEQTVRFKALVDGKTEGDHAAAIQHKISTLGTSTEEQPIYEEQDVTIQVPQFETVTITKDIFIPFIGFQEISFSFTQFTGFQDIVVGTELVQVGTETIDVPESDAFTGVIEAAGNIFGDPSFATLTDNDASFPEPGDPGRPDGLRGAFVTIIDDEGNPESVGQTRMILSNTATELTLDQPWSSTPSNQARYEIQQYSGLVVPTVEVGIYDADIASLVVEQTEGQTITSEGSASGWDLLRVALSQAPEVGETITVNLNGHGQLEFRDPGTDAIITSLTFDETDWDAVQEIKVTAVDDEVTEGFHRSDITMTASSSDPGSDYNGVEHTLVADIGDNEFAQVLVKQTNGSTDLVEGGGTDQYSVVLTKAPLEGETVTVNVVPQPTRTSRTGTTPHPDSVRSFQEQVEVSLNGTDWFASVDLEFTDADWDTEQTVYVRAIDDNIVDGGDSKVFAPILDLANNIKGPLFIVGGFGEDRSGLFEREPIMLPGEFNEKESFGDVLAATEEDGDDPATLTISLLDPGDEFVTDVVDFLGKVVEDLTPEDFLELTVEITRGEGKNKVRIIEAAELLDQDENGTPDAVKLTLNKAWDIPFSPEGVPDAGSEFQLSSTNPNFLVEETDQTDLLFFKDTDNPANFEESAFAAGQLFFDDSFGFTGHRITGLGMGGDRNIGGTLQPGGVSFQQLEEVEIVLGTGNNEFTIEDTHEGTTTLMTGDGADTVHVKGVSGHTFVNTGSDNDTVNIHNDGQTLEDLLGLLTVSGDIPQAHTVHFANGSPADGSVPAVDAIQHLTIDATGGTFTLFLGGETTVDLDHDADEGTVQAALEGLSTIGAGNVEVTKAGSFYRVKFINDMGAQAVDLLAVNDFNLTNGLGTHDVLNIDDSGFTDPSLALLTQTTLTGLSTQQTNEIQTLVIDAQPGGTELDAGTFRLSYDGDETADLAYNISAAELQSALEGLAGIGGGNVAVTQNDDVYVIRFQGDLTNTDVSQILVSNADLTKTAEIAPDVFDTVAGSAETHTRVNGNAEDAVNDMQQLTVNATGGTYTLSLLGRTSDPIAYDASAEVVRKTLQVMVADDDLEEIKTDVTVDKYGNTYLIGFQGKLRELGEAEGVELLTVDTTNLTGGAEVATRMDGINYYGFETLNLSLGSNDDILSVQGTSPGSNGFAADGGVAVTNIDLGTGDEQIFVSSNADMDFNTVGGFDFLTGDLDAVEGALNLDTGNGRHRLMISDEGATVGDDDVTITDTAPGALNGLSASSDIWIQGLAPAGISYGTDGNFYDGISYWSGSGADTIYIDGTHYVNGERTATLLNTGLGSDHVTVDLDEDGDDGFFVLNTMGGAESAAYNDRDTANVLAGESYVDDDTVDATASSLPLLIFGGIGDDTILSGSGEDVIFGDFGRVFYVNGLGTVSAVFGFGGRGDRISSDILPANYMFSLHRTIGGMDWVHGGAADDIVIGGANDDRLDGGDHRDLMFGDNVELNRLGDALNDFTNPRYRTLMAGATAMYGETPGVDDGEALQGDTHHEDPNGNPVWGDFDITLLDHSAADEAAGLNNFGDDYMAGGADDDQIFGMLGDDTIQGDGSIGTVEDPTLATAYRTALNMLMSTPSVENALTDGDDYIEGNGGNDVIFGNLGQDDIVGGSSSLFSLVTPEQRPDGMDLLFGGAGTDLARNNLGDSELADGHALDSDAIAGDNANIYRLLQTGDTSQFETFNYDANDPARGSLRIIPRPVELLDYSPGGPDFHSATPETLGDIGDNDEIHGESGDDFIYGMTGNDVLFGEGQDDDLIGGWGHDWISGGSGEDGVLGDDGRIYTSRNSDVYGEDLYGIEPVQTDQTVSGNGPWLSAVIHEDGRLKKTVNLTPFNVDPSDPQEFLYNAQFADDVIYGGLHDDWLHGGSGDDAISGAEALATAAATVYPDDGTTNGGRSDGVVVTTGYDTPLNPGHILGFEALIAEEFAAYDENDPMRKILVDGQEFFLNFNETEGPTAFGSDLPTDGNDRIFGDLGNDWIVGGTGRDHTYGGYGNDLLNNDDNHNSTAGTGDPTANDSVDGPEYSYEDISFGGAGRDVLIANTAGDRQIDWKGEFNSYIVPFSPFGPGGAIRSPAPHVVQFLYDLSVGDGIDMTRAADTGSDPSRNGEPFGELGLVTQQDADWGDQHGAPDDPQPGNGQNQSDLNGPNTAQPNSGTSSTTSTTSSTSTLTTNSTTGGTSGEDDSETLVFDDSSGNFTDDNSEDTWVVDDTMDTGTGEDSFGVSELTEEEFLVLTANDDDWKGPGKGPGHGKDKGNGKDNGKKNGHGKALIDWNGF